MKKNNNKDELSKLLTKYKYTYLIGFISLFFVLSAILGLIAYITISANYLYNSKAVISQYITSVTEPEVGGYINTRPNDPRMIARFFYTDSQTGELQSVMVGLTENDDETNNAFLYAFSNKDFNENLEKYYTTSIYGYTNLCYTTKIKESNTLQIRIGNTRVEDVTYIKVYMNIAGEESARQSFFRVYITCAIAITLLSALCGWIMTQQSVKPLKVFVKKQIDFVSDASHELRTPLAVVQSKIENILANPEQTVYEASESLAISLNEINRLTKLTQELLTLARNDKNNIKLDMELVNVNDKLKEIIEPFTEIAMIQERELHYIGLEDVYAYLDVDKFKQILIINIDNALKYTEPGDTIDIILQATSNELSIEVRDTGVGINENTKEHIFERFYREDKARSRETGGNGLGLAIAHTLVSLQRGKITVDHNYPKGTKFTITFPRVKRKIETTNE